MRQALIDLRDKITGDLSISRTRVGMRERKEYWAGYIQCLRNLGIKYGRIVPTTLALNEYRAFREGLNRYSGAFLSVQIGDEDISGVTVTREPSPEEPKPKPCPDGTLFRSDPRTRIKLGGG